MGVGGRRCCVNVCTLISVYSGIKKITKQIRKVSVLFFLFDRISTFVGYFVPKPSLQNSDDIT